MVREYESIVKEMKDEYTRPPDLRNEELIFGPQVLPVLFTKMSSCEKEAYTAKMLHVGPSNKFFTKPGFKSENEDEIIWDVSDDKRGVFTDDGCFVLEDDAAKVSTALWFFQVNSGQIQGPFTSHEMAEKSTRKELDAAVIKRDRDSVFLGYKELETQCPVFSDDPRINEMFVEAAQKAVAQKVETVKKPFAESAKETPRLKSAEVQEILEKCKKSKDFLLRKKSKVDIAKVEQRLKGLDKATCVGIISEVTGMGKADSEAFLDLFATESKLPVCCNIDDEGFEAVVPRDARNSSRRSH